MSDERLAAARLDEELVDVVHVIHPAREEIDRKQSVLEVLLDFAVSLPLVFVVTGPPSMHASHSHAIHATDVAPRRFLSLRVAFRLLTEPNVSLFHTREHSVFCVVFAGFGEVAGRSLSERRGLFQNRCLRPLGHSSEQGVSSTGTSGFGSPGRIVVAAEKA